MEVAAGIIANGVTEILKKLSSVVANEITLVWDFNDELKNLQSTLNMILDVMEDAEKKQLSKAAVRRWMEELKAIAYDAEDILDEYSYEVIRCKHQQKDEEEYKSTVFNKVHNIFSSSKPSFVVSWKLAHKVKKINEKFNKIAKRKNDLGLQTIDVGSSSSQYELMMKNRETNSFVPEDWKIFGRENDKSTIIKMLLEEEEEKNSSNQGGGGKHISVIPIVGMGGLGKTTMAQQVYNDEVVKKHFQLKIWICVSDPFDVKKLLTNIAISIGVAAKQYDNMDDIVCRLREALREKKFLLVLDDVWNENFEDWCKLKTPLMGAAEGSKILVTTRSVKVAELMVHKFPHYELGILNHNDSWSLFKEIAFGSATGAVETPKLVEIGEEMVKKCGGLPLAVIFLGSLMRSKKKEEEWKIIRDTKLWHESREGKNSNILPSLKLSYDYLPSHLKLCFSYCCLFPKDSLIQREKLIRLWMAEGFLIESPGENAMSMEEIGNEYFHSLLSSFFFHDVEKDEDGDVWSCKMHDLVHDLARSVVEKNECLIVENAHDIDCISEETRRLNLLVNLDDGGILLPKVLKAVKKAKKLRTVFVNKQTIRFDIGNAFKENKRLRVLDLSGSSPTESTFSSSIGRLKHLRYLSVFGVAFPKEMICRLSFLQTLSYFNVGDKKEDKNGIEELESLNLLGGDLSIYSLQNVTSETNACKANLKEKKNLRGLKLFWMYGRNAKNYEEAVLEGLRPHPNLTTLEIESFGGSKLPRWIQEDSSSCLPNLVELTLNDCSYIEQVAGFGALPSLRSLNLIYVYKLKCIGNEFYYSAAVAGGSSSSSSSSSAGGGGGGGESRSSTASTGEASTAAATIAFPSLKKLMLESMGSLEEWVVPAVSPQASTTGATTTTTTYCFPLLEEITIKECSRLNTITPTTTIFPSLKVLDIDGIDGSAGAVETLVTNNLNSLTSLRLRAIHNLITLPRQGLVENNNTLLSLEIFFCFQFEGFFPPNNNEEEEGHDDDDDHDQGEGGGGGGGGQQLQQISKVVSLSSCSSSSSSSSSSLQSLKLYGCPALRSYPNILRSLTSLRALVIEECKESQSLLTCLSSSSSSPSSLEHLEHVQIMHKEGLVKSVVLEWRKSSSFQGMKH